MRVISGKYKGIKLDGFDLDETRPTMDRVKESVFGMIQDYVEGNVCLDLFAGFGQMGIEMLSNGAKKCFFIDNSDLAVKIIKQNISNAKITEEIEIIKDDYKIALASLKNVIKFDLIYIDPPYKMTCLSYILDLIHDYKLLKNDGVVVCEYDKDVPESNDYIVFKERKYGPKYIRILRKK